MILDRFISVDIEASGPVPGEFSMLSLGACVVGKTEEQFYVELKPITHRQDAASIDFSSAIPSGSAAST